MDEGNTSCWKYLIFLLISVVPLFCLGLSNHGVWTADEPRVAEIGREMAQSGSYAVPTLDGRPFLEEPPLYYAAIAAVFKLAGGASDRVVRVPSAVFGLAGVVALFFLGAMLFGPRAGFLSGFVMATSGEYFRVAHWVVVDSALACFVILALTFFAAAYLTGAGARRKRLLFYGLCYLCCTLAFYTKGFIGVAIPGLAVLVFLAFGRDLRQIGRMHLWLGVVIFAALTLPWFLALYRQGGPEYLKVFLVHNHLERFAGGSTGHSQPFYYYLTQFPGGFLPWSILIVPVLWLGFTRVRGLEGARRTGVLLALCWFVAGFLFLSAASTKRVLYLMPVFAPVSLLTGLYIDATSARKAARWFEKAFEVLFGLAPLVAGLAAFPAYHFLSWKYGLIGSWRDAASIAAFSAAAVALAAAGLRLYGKNVGRFWLCSGASVFCLLLLALITVVPLLDRYKSFVPFCDDIRARVPAAAKLYAYQPDETLRGAVPFYTGRFLAETETLASLCDAAEREKEVFVVVRDSKGTLERAILSTGRFSVAARRGDRARSLVLFAGRPASP